MTQSLPTGFSLLLLLVLSALPTSARIVKWACVREHFDGEEREGRHLHSLTLGIGGENQANQIDPSELLSIAPKLPSIDRLGSAKEKIFLSLL
jgi:hypothetical protein